MKTIIGINCGYSTVSDDNDLYYKLHNKYIEAILLAGGLPLLIPFFGTERDYIRLISKIDGLLLSGGPDINPKRWKEKIHPKTNIVHPDKERSDFILTKLALKYNLPILGICYGMQLINVVCGGTLYQHIPDLRNKMELCKEHLNVDPPSNTTHKIQIIQNSCLSKILGKEGQVNSFHHQAVKNLGRDLRPVATAKDGIIEAIESTKYKFIVGVQWHPERMLHDKYQAAIFKGFIKICSQK